MNTKDIAERVLKDRWCMENELSQLAKAYLDLLEPTKEMIEAGAMALSSNGAEGGDDEMRSDAEICYKAMIAKGTEQ